MKIRIDDEYSNLGNGLNIVLDEYSKEKLAKQVDSNFGENNFYEISNDNEFNVEIQYLEEGVARSNYDNKKNYISGNAINYNEINRIAENTINYDNDNSINKNDIDEDNYTNNINEKYNEYDKFCYNQEINYNYEDKVNYDEPIDYNDVSKINYSEFSNFNSEEKIEESKYLNSNFEEELNYSNDLELISENSEYIEDYSKKEWENNEDSIRVDNISMYNEEEISSNIEDIDNGDEIIFNNNDDIFNNNDDIFNNNEVESKNDYLNNYDSSELEYYDNGFENNYGNKYEENCKITKGEIKVSVRLGDRNGIEIKGAKINLYELNGVCPRLYESNLTDQNGEVIFKGLENGCYRVISLVDRRFFEKPIYVTWNEVIIDNLLKEANICVVNRVKPSCLKR